MSVKEERLIVESRAYSAFRSSGLTDEGARRHREGPGLAITHLAFRLARNDRHA
jgi:hypothetical protein